MISGGLGRGALSDLSAVSFDHCKDNSCSDQLVVNICTSFARTKELPPFPCLCMLILIDLFAFPR
jgi:hypothetical protein